MKTKSYFLAMIAVLFTTGIFAQDRTTVTAKNYDISDNLDLRAVASIFGESRDLEDFERRLNDPKTQISNLDLNGDRRVDYLRVIETIDNGVHLIVIQSVLDKDVFQDVATIEVEKDRNNSVQVQVVGNVYMYGPDYVYQPVFVTRPIIYDYFWVTGYRPYWSSWYWGYYPSYYYYWEPYPIFRYRRHIHTHINVNNTYVYVNNPRNVRSYQLSGNYRGNGYEVRNPGRAFNQRNNTRNSYELQEVRSNSVRANTASRTDVATNVRSNTTETRSNVPTGSQASGNVRSQTGTRTYPGTTVRNQNFQTNGRDAAVTPRTNTGTRYENTPRVNTRTETPAVQQAPQTNTRSEGPVRSQAPEPQVNQSPRSTSPRAIAPQPSSPRTSGNAGGNGSRPENRSRR